MRIIISSAKKMVVDTDSFPVDSLPRFLEQAEQLKKVLQALSPKELQDLWKCNDAITKLNVERLEHMDLRRHLTPAVLSYEGIQYRYMAPGVMETAHLDYLREHLRILSGFYGLLCPFDGVTPYRLEMQARLSAAGAKDLYEFWGTSIADSLFAETDCVVNLASREYSACVSRYVPEGARFVTCVFGERKGDKVIEKGTQCKMARGEMVRYMAERQVAEPEELRAFAGLSYRFSPEQSDDTVYVFIRGGKTWT